MRNFDIFEYFSFICWPTWGSGRLQGLLHHSFSNFFAIGRARRSACSPGAPAEPGGGHRAARVPKQRKRLNLREGALGMGVGPAMAPPGYGPESAPNH